MICEEHSRTGLNFWGGSRLISLQHISRILLCQETFLRAFRARRSFWDILRTATLNYILESAVYIVHRLEKMEETELCARFWRCTPKGKTGRPCKKMERRIVNTNRNSQSRWECSCSTRLLSDVVSCGHCTIDVMFFITHTYRILLNAVLEAVLHTRIRKVTAWESIK